MKRFMPLGLILALLIPMLTQAVAFGVPEDFLPDDAAVTLDFQLQGKLKKMAEPFLKEVQEGMGESDEMLSLLIDKLLAGDRFFLSFSPPQDLYLSIPVTDGEWQTITEAITEKEEPEIETRDGNTIYHVSDGKILRIGNFAVDVFAPGGVGVEAPGLDKVLGLATGSSTNSLTNHAAYKKVTNSYVSPRTLGLTFNVKKLLEAVTPLIGEDENTVAVLDSLFGPYEFEGGSFGETAEGYKFNFMVTGNPDELRKKGISLNPGGSFTPNFYKKFPKAKPIFYSESFNPKAGFLQSKKMLDDLGEATGGDDFDIYEEIEKETGFDLGGLFNLFEREFAFGLQYDKDSPLPYFTVMGDVSADRAGAEKLIQQVVKLIIDGLKKNGVPKKGYKLTQEGVFTKLVLDLTKFTKEYYGPPFPKISLAFGVTDDNLLIVSTYPDIEKEENRTGFTLPVELKPMTSLFYLSMRNIWEFSDGLFAWGERVGGGEHGAPIEAYQNYYSALDALYGWKELVITSEATETEAKVNGSVVIDNAKHETYEELLEKIKASDRDGDGVSDYDERYVYNTPVESGDSDGDGVSDFEELMKGENPNGEGRLFKDVQEDTYYTDEAAFLYQRGAIRGYDDGTFQPGKLVNRAEFTTMVVKAFELDTSSFLGLDVELKEPPPPFTDIDSLAWYASPVSKAYGAGFISGSTDPKTGELVFRPGANINRAEAIAILNKAAKSLKKTHGQTSCEDTPFKDVGREAWYCDAVANGYANGLTKGKTADTFKPDDFLTRAEAAVMIRRAIEKDVETISEGTESFGELTEPLGARALPLTRALTFPQITPKRQP